MEQLGDAEPTRADQGGGPHDRPPTRQHHHHCRHQLTNAVAEGLNSKIMAIKRRAGGYRNVGNFKDVIYLGVTRKSLCRSLAI